jgi:hypothetical protein
MITVQLLLFLSRSKIFDIINAENKQVEVKDSYNVFIGKYFYDGNIIKVD